MGAVVAFKHPDLERCHEITNQNTLTDSVTIIGVGSIGSILAEDLVRTKSVNKINLIDFDIVDERNVYNSAYQPNHIGYYKVDALKEKLDYLYPNTAQINTFKETFINQENLVEPGSICIDCRDRHYKDGFSEISHKLYMRGSKSLIVDARPNEYRYTSNTTYDCGVCADKDVIYKLVRIYILQIKEKYLDLTPHQSIYSISNNGEIQEIKMDKNVILNGEKIEELKSFNIDHDVLLYNITRFIESFREDSSAIIIHDFDTELYSPEFKILPIISEESINIKRVIYEISWLLKLFRDYFDSRRITTEFKNNSLFIFPDHPNC